ncbi:hypothetical protein XFF6991_530147 [Xanthomonas phaseoli pv. phaseoli]|uniref:Uncharacterized protein n=1 Tax=Xanthomonas campestris pv. phaseoli TaxID=317013 RepID=A0A7Z7J4X4_XANCH|nr:hypothetical protein XFF6991_530147 [Xanthomonas phaseoli pv. phaseoli]
MTVERGTSHWRADGSQTDVVAWLSRNAPTHCDKQPTPSAPIALSSRCLGTAALRASR